MNQTLQSLIKTGIPVTEAEFHAAVSNSDRTFETRFSAKSNVVSRRVEMWYTPHTLICRHKGKYFGVPTASVKYANFKDDKDDEDNVVTKQR